MDWQPSMGVVYTAWHCDGRFSMRGVKLERDTEPSARVRPLAMRPAMIAQTSALCMVVASRRGFERVVRGRVGRGRKDGDGCVI